MQFRVSMQQPASSQNSPTELVVWTFFASLQFLNSFFLALLPGLNYEVFTKATKTNIKWSLDKCGL